MPFAKKQTKINKLFRNIATKTKAPDECDELLAEVEQLRQRLQEKNNELFLIRRTQNRCKAKLPIMKSDNFVGPNTIVLQNSVDTLKSKIEVMSMLTSVEVQSFVLGDHCCVVFHMQHDSPHAVKHGLRIDIRDGVNQIVSTSLPLGFNLAAVVEEYDDVMNPNCLSSIRRALFAYYNRLEQYEALKTLVSIDANLFKLLDGSHVQIKLCVQSDVDDDEDPLEIELLLDYRVYDIRPKTFAIKDAHGSHEGSMEALKEQCTVFKKQPLEKAFRQAFISGGGMYKLVSQMGGSPAPLPPRRRRRARPRAPQHYNNDDTFRPEQCSESEHSDEEPMEE